MLKAFRGWSYNIMLVRATAHAFSSQFPTEVARVRTHVMSCGTCGGRRVIGVDFLCVLLFPLPFHITSAPH
jgi:hypothetical protein